MSNITVADISNAILAGMKASSTGPRCGCGRAYVLLEKTDRGTLEKYKLAAIYTNVRYLDDAYGAGKRALYIGYDNGTGIPLAQAEAIATNLRAIGLPAYDEGVAD